MLLKQTIFYLPAQLLPAAAQFASLIFWSHLAEPEVVGIVTLYISIQEFLVTGFMGFWSSYTVRFGMKEVNYSSQVLRDQTSTTFVFCSSIAQSIVAALLYFFVIDGSAPFYIVPLLMCMTWGRAFNHFQGERGRARGDILLYSVEVVSGPVLGMGISLALLWKFGSSELWIFLGYAIAQLTAAIYGICKDRSWIRFGHVDISILRHAISYGAPLMLSSAFMWGVQNAPRWIVSVYLGLTATGIYSLGFGLGFRVAIVAAMSVNAAAFPLAAKLANRGDYFGAMNQLSQNAILLMSVLAPSMVGFALLSHDIVHFVVPQRLQESVYPILLWSIIAGSMICVRQYLFNQVFLLQGNTRVIALVSIIELFPAAILSIILIPKFGAVGGIISLTVTSAVSMLVMMALALREGLRLAIRDLVKIALATALMALFILILPAESTVQSLSLRIAIGGVTFVVALAAMYHDLLATALFSRSARRP